MILNRKRNDPSFDRKQMSSKLEADCLTMYSVENKETKAPKLPPGTAQSSG